MPRKHETEDSKAREAEYQRRYFAENRSRILERRREKRAADKAAGKSPPKSGKRSSPNQSEEAIEARRQKCREYYAANREKSKARVRQWRIDNRDRVLATSRAYRENHAEEIKARFNANEDGKRRRYAYLANWQKKKAAEDPCFVEYRLILNRMYRAMKRHLSGRRVTSASKIVQLLGCDWLAFIAHIESQFQPGMTWENHGHSGWHFDHIVPLSAFDLTDEEQRKKGCHYTNVQPLWAADNIRKGGKVA